jgi:hypothetical protein
MLLLLVPMHHATKRKETFSMTMKINCGLAKKLGLPNYGSIAANCGVEFEVDAAVLSDAETFQRHVRNAYTACRDAVVQELARQQANEPAASAAPNGRSRNGTAAPPAAHGSKPQNGNGNGQQGNRASDKQVEYMRQLAKQISGLGARRLDGLAQQMFGKNVADLTTLDASGVIDCLKGIKAGEIDLQAALGGEAASAAG